MSATPRLSVLIPVRDAARTLPACLRSLQRQSESDWECVVVDDGSRDESRALARHFARDDARFRIVAAGREGLVPALRRGLAECRGRAVARMDADDLMHRDRLRLQADALDADPKLAGVGSHVRIFPRSVLRDGMRAYEAWLASIDSPARVREEAFVECPIAHPTLTIRSDVIRELSYRDCGWPEDYDLVLRLLESGRELGVVPRRLLCWRHTAGRHSQTSPVYTSDRFSACKAEFLARTFLARDDRYLLWGYGGTGRALHRALREHGKQPSAILELHPGRIGNAIHGAPVIHPQELGGPDLRLVVSVAGERARALIRAELARRGWRETVDYVCAA